MQFRFNVIRVISKIHGYIYSGSGGRIGKKLGNQNIALLTTIGRKSGKRRNVPLAGIGHEEKYLIIGSFGGSPVHTAWILNVESNPDVIFHFAAQSLVVYGYEFPRETFSTNVMGTVNVLDSIQGFSKEIAVVIVTSDKCYKIS